MTNSTQTALLGGAVLGLVGSATLFFTVPVYHDYLVWAWTTPWLVPLGLASGIAVALLTD